MNNSSNSRQLPTVIIKDDQEFAELCRQWSEGVILALDTEFVRTNTFYSNIGLLQLADTTACYLVDPLCIEDWSEFSQLLENPACSFVIHSCSEDLNLLYTFLGVVPRNLFDTQVAAAFVGLGYSISYQGLVSELLGIELDKGETRSDWLRRPLSERQLEYAALDVLYLLELQSMMQAQLEERGMLGWLQAECDYRVANATGSEQEATWELLYAGFSNAWRMSDTALNYLQKLCYWREQESRSRNKPRSWVAKDQDLGAIATHMASATELTLSELSNVKVSERKLLARNAEQLIALLQRSDLALVAVDRAALIEPLTSALRKKLKACQQVVAVKAESLAIAPELLGRKKQLQEVIRSFDRIGEITWDGGNDNWRAALLDDELKQVLKGSD